MAEDAPKTSTITCNSCGRTKEQPLTEKIFELRLARLLVAPDTMEEHCDLGDWRVISNRYVCGACHNEGLRPSYTLSRTDSFL